MIFATFGTHHDPFPRLVEGLETLGGEELVVQHGHSAAPASATEAVDFMSFAEMVERIRAARVVVSHAGVGSILTCVHSGQTPLVVPRQHRFGEHVDDHQVELTRALAQHGKVIPVWDIETLPELIASAPAPATHTQRPSDLHRAVREALDADRPRRPWGRSMHGPPVTSS